VNVAQFPLPVFTGIGHDHDYHIIDMVAHTNVKTPTALADYMVDIFAQEDYQVDSLLSRLSSAVRSKIVQQEAEFDSMVLRISNAAASAAYAQNAALDKLEIRVNAADPAKVLARGYSVAIKDGRRIHSTDGLSAGDDADLMLSDGLLKVEIKEIHKYE